MDKRFFNSQSIIKEFECAGKYVQEKVAVYPKILYQDSNPAQSAKVLELYPGGKLTSFSLRIDADEVETNEFSRYLDILAPYSKWVTIFCCCQAFLGKESILRKIRESGFDIQSHGYYHHTYRDYENNLHNIRKSKEYFSYQGIETTGFAAPMGTYNQSLTLALEASGYRYSSDFSFDYLNFPHYPRLKNAVSKVLQVPVFPVCPELLLQAKVSVSQIVSYYSRAIVDLKRAHIPIIIYAHTDIRFPKVKEVLKQILEKIKSDDTLYMCNMTEFVSWCTRIEDKGFAQVSGILNPSVCVQLKAPDNEFLGVPKKTGLVKQCKDLVKKTLDFERITPTQELKGNKFRKLLKVASRRYIKQK